METASPVHLEEVAEVPEEWEKVTLRAPLDVQLTISWLVRCLWCCYFLGASVSVAVACDPVHTLSVFQTPAQTLTPDSVCSAVINVSFNPLAEEKHFLPAVHSSLKSGG